MFLRFFTLTLEPVNPLRFSLEECRTFFNRGLPRTHFSTRLMTIFTGTRHSSANTSGMSSIAVGISQGAGLLRQLAENRDTLLAGENACTITGRDPALRNEEFGISGFDCWHMNS